MLVLSIAYAFVNCNRTRQNLSGNITVNDIEKVKTGMTLEQVEHILGRPYKIESLAGLHVLNCPNPKPMLTEEIKIKSDIRQIVEATFSDTNYCCEGNKEDLQTKRVTLTYSKPVMLSKYYPMLWVHLDSNYRVYHVYAKRYAGGIMPGESTIYSLDREDEYIIENLFYSTF